MEGRRGPEDLKEPVAANAGGGGGGAAATAAEREAEEVAAAFCGSPGREGRPRRPSSSPSLRRWPPVPHIGRSLPMAVVVVIVLLPPTLQCFLSPPCSLVIVSSAVEEKRCENVEEEETDNDNGEEEDFKIERNPPTGATQGRYKKGGSMEGEESTGVLSTGNACTQGHEEHGEEGGAGGSVTRNEVNDVEDEEKEKEDEEEEDNVTEHVGEGGSLEEKPRPLGTS